MDQYPLAQIYCDIADCLELINQYDNAKVKQTDKMYDVYRQLWEKIQELKSTADRFGDVDAIHKSVIVQEIKNLQQKIIETVQKIDSVQKEAGTS